MSLNWRRVLVSMFVSGCFGALRAQAPSPSSGEITVLLVQGLDSAANPKAMSEGRVTKSSNPAIPVGSTATLGLTSDPINGGYTVTLLRLGINGQMTPAASSDVEAAPDFFNKTQEKLRAKGQPQDAVKGTRVFLPQRMIVRFTLAAPPPPRQGTAASTSPPSPAPVHVLPKHPAPTVVDLPSAYPGAPSLHASRAANDGCWWEPFAGRNLGFELPAQQCDDPERRTSFAETATGLSFKQGTESGTAFTMLTKPATQTLEAAIKAQFLKTSADRTSCFVKRLSDPGDLQMYGVSAAHSKKTTCAGLFEDDPDAAEATTFLYNPAESKTKYLKYTGEGMNTYPFDLQALHFAEVTNGSSDSHLNASNAPSTLPSSAVGVPPGAAAGSASPLPAGPVGPVNRLNVRGISVRMERAQILAAGKEAGMVILSNVAQQIQMVDPTVTNQTPGKPRSGLILSINLVNDTAVSANIGEQGGSHGEVFEDLSKNGESQRTCRLVTTMN